MATSVGLDKCLILPLLVSPISPFIIVVHQEITVLHDDANTAFDPIFFLHHCNVDRMISLWSALNPGVWVSKGDSEDGSFTLPPEAPVDTTTGTNPVNQLVIYSYVNLFLAALTPFWDTNTTFWASSGTTDTTKLGYSYPEFNGLDMGNPQAVKVAIGDIVNRLYGFSIFGSFAPTTAPTTSFFAASAAAAEVPVETKRAPTPLAAAPHAHSLLVANGHDRGTHPIVQPHHYVPPNHGVWDWTARVEFRKYELGVGFSVLLFLGKVPDDPEEWPLCSNFVGAHHAFVNTAAGHCANCRNQGTLVEEGFVHLNHAIAQHSGLSSLEPEVVEPYLTEQLHWRVQKVGLYAFVYSEYEMILNCINVDRWIRC